MRAWGWATATSPSRSARVVGDVLGKYHPHGDASAYEAMVRMAQDFSLRYPLVDGQGNFGSRDGDNAAAMRYTEARLAPIARNCCWPRSTGHGGLRANYDGATRSPRCCRRACRSCCSTAQSGIAVGMATEIPAHNLREVAKAAVRLVRDPDLDDKALLSCIPGPDFPGGGQIISSARDIRDCYPSGRGR